ncbi:MAG TPA: DNA primase [Candidatus Lambdaproteobacteria bacterium]|nr:DNA primase [Candidatus Lambdaproteobacteria bacterium]
MQFSKSFIRKVADATNLVDLISEHGIMLKRAGTNYKGLCPFHAEKTPSFSVNPVRGFFHCFGCNASGDGIKFLIQYDRLSFTEAIEELAKRANIPLEFESGSSRRKNPEEDSGLRCLREAATFYRKKLTSPAGESALRYLHQRSVPESMWELFQLGVSADGWQDALNHLQQNKISVKDLLQTGLIKISEKSGRHYDTFRGRLMFPIRDIRGRCIGFGARSIKPEDKPKYLNSPETLYYQKSHVLYGLYEGLSSIRKLRRLIFVEGYLDVMRLHENGFTDAVATCGTALTPDHLKIVRRYADTVILLFDGDTAGKNAALRHAHLLLPHALESYIITLPEGDDPDTFLLKQGKAGFEELLERKTPAIDYLVQQTINKYPNSIQGRMQGLEELLPTLNEISDPKRRQLSLMAIGERMKIPAEILSRELKRKANKNLSNNNNDVKLSRLSNNPVVSQDEQWLLQSLLRKGEMWPLVREHLIPEEFRTPHFQQLYAKLLQLPDAAFQAFDPLELEQTDPELFQSVMLLLTEEIPSHDFSLSLMRIKERNLDINFQEWLLSSNSDEERARAGLKRRKEEMKLKEIKKIFNNILTL